MPDPVHLPVSLKPGQHARNAAPQPFSAPGQGAEAPFARSLAQLLLGGTGLPPQQGSSAGGGTDLPPPDQILPPDGQTQAPPVRWQPGSGVTDGEGNPLGTGTGLPLLSGQDRPLASQQVLEHSQRELSDRVTTSTEADAEELPQSGPKQELLLQPGQQTEQTQRVRAEGQPADGMQARRPEAAEQPLDPRYLRSGEPNSDSGGYGARPAPVADSGVELQSLNGVREGERARSADQAWADRPVERRGAWQEGIVQRQRGEGKQAEPASQPVAVAADSANDSTGQSQSVASIGSVSRAAPTDPVEGPQRPAERSVAGTEPPAWQSGRSSEPLELASSLAGDRLQRFAEQWSSQMNERGGQTAGQGHGAGNPAGASSQTGGSAPMTGENGGPAGSSAAQASSSAVPSTTPQAGSMSPLPSLTTMPGSSVEAAARSTLNPDGALAGSREAFGSSGAGQSGAREQWGEALSQRISLMTARNQSEARIQLDPPELGRLMIQIQVNSEQASVSFTSPHALVRDALEANVPRLQEMLSEQGLDLLDVDISDQSQQQADEQNEDDPSLLAGTGDDEGNVDEAAAPLMTEGSLSLVDDYV